MIASHHGIHRGSRKFVVVIGIVVICRKPRFHCATLARIRHPDVLRIERSLVRIETSKTIRPRHGAFRQILRHNVDDAAHAIRRETFRHIALVNFNAVNLIHRNVIHGKASIAVVHRDAVHKDLHVFAFHAADVDFIFAAHPAGLANFHTRRAVRHIGDGSA